MSPQNMNFIRNVHARLGDAMLLWVWRRVLLASIALSLAEALVVMVHITGLYHLQHHVNVDQQFSVNKMAVPSILV